MALTGGLGLAVLASLMFAALDGLRKHLVRSLSPVALGALLNLGQAVLLLGAAREVPAAPWAFYGVVAVTASIATLTALLYLEAVKVSPLSLTIPYLAFTPALLLVTASILLGEQPSWRGALGVLLVTAGAYVLPGLSSWRAPLAALGRERGSRLMLAVAAIWAVSSALDKLALRWASPTYYGGLVLLLSGSALLVMALRQRPQELAEARRVWPWLVGAAALAACALWAQYASYAALPVSYTVAIKRAGMLVSVVIGRVFFGEGQLASRLVGATTMVAGVALIVTSA